MHLGYRKTFLIINVLHLVCPEILLKELIHYGVAHETRRETESVPRAIGTGTSFARDDEQNKGTIPMPMFGSRPSTMSSSILMDIPQNPMVGQQRQPISELQFDKFPTPRSFFVGR